MGINFRSKVNSTQEFSIGNSVDDTNPSKVIVQIYTLADKFKINELSAKTFEFFEDTKNLNDGNIQNKIKPDKYKELQEFNNEIRIVKLLSGIVSIDGEKVTKEMLLDITSDYVLEELEKAVDEVNNEKEIEKTLKN